MVSGKLWRNSLIMQDKETGSLWSHITGESLEGSMKGQRLMILPSVQATWASWAKQHPDTKVLRKEHAIRSSRYERYFNDPSRIGIFRTRWLVERMPGKSIVYGITEGPYAMAITNDKLTKSRLLNIKVGDNPVVVILSADEGVRAYRSQASGQTLHFYLSGQTPVIKDKETLSIWNLDKGVCLAGSLQGTNLDEVVVHLTFWFAWSTFYPNTEVMN